MSLIVYTRWDGGVNVCMPHPVTLRAMCHGGDWGAVNSDFIDEQIIRQVAAGHHEWAARRFAAAVAFGGCTTAEALEIIRDRDCAHLGTAHELYERLPSKWFRDAWRRSLNGGPIHIDMRKARRIQLQRITAAAARSRAVIQLGRWKDRVRRAQTPEQLRSVWPEGVNR